MESRRMIIEYTIPPFECYLFPTRCHPCFPDLEEEGNAWILSNYFKFSSESQRKHIINHEFPLFVSVTYAAALEYPRLMTVFKVMAWIFLLDDIVDDASSDIGTNVSSAGHRFDHIVAVLQGVKECPDRMASIITMWWFEMAHNMSKRQQHRFIESIRISFESWKRQIYRRQFHHIPDLDLDAYITHRREASFVETSFILLEYSLGIEIDDAILQHPLIAQLHAVANDHISWVNDLLSFKSEYVEGDMENIASVITRHSCNTFQESVQQVHTMIQERYEECVNLINKIQKTDSLVTNFNGLDKYVKGIGDWLSGNVYWHYKTKRYHVDGPKSRNAPLPVIICDNVAPTM